MTPEEKARIKIDQWLTEAGWKVINREEYEPTCTAVAIREGLLKGNLEADYFLFINGKAVGVLEAKREETDAFSAKCVSKLHYMLKVYPISTKRIRSHYPLSLPPTARNYISVISRKGCLFHPNNDYTHTARTG